MSSSQEKRKREEEEGERESEEAGHGGEQGVVLTFYWHQNSPYFVPLTVNEC